MPSDHRPSEDHIAALVETVNLGREDVRARHEAGAGGIETTRRLSDLVDRVIGTMYSIALERVKGQPASESSITIAATGGYGRRRLAPFSDIDVTFIVSEEDDPWLDGVAKEMFLLITSVFTQGVGLKVGYAYRTLRDLQEIDTQTQTALLDARLVVGDRPLFYRFREELIRFIRPAVFVQQKLEERKEALTRHGDSIYQVEPNIKMGAGGLRDLHMAEWLAKATMGTGLEDPWGRLRTIGLIQEDEFHAINAGREFMLRLRNALHWLSGKPLDALTSERQPEVAAQLGYQPDAKRTAVEFLMADYYRHAATIQRISHKVPAKATKHPLRLDPGLVVKNGHITATGVDLLVNEPSAALRILHLSQQYGFPLSPEVEEMIGDHVARTDALMDDPDSRRLFLQILRHESEVYHTLRQLADLGVLPKVIPAYGDLLHLLPAEPIHHHTVGEHSLRVVRELERLRDDRDPDNPLFREVFAGLERSEVLFLAALLHDVGKIRSAGRHAEVGAQMVRTTGFNLGIDEEGIELLAFLVQHHDLMSTLARTRDPEQPETIAELIAIADNANHLASLFLLACADLSTLGSDTWIQVQIDFLCRLFVRADRTLSKPDSNEPTPEEIQSGLNRLQRQLNLRNLPEDTVRDFCREMPASYLLNTNLEQVIRHIQALERLDSGPVVDFHEERRKPWTVMTIAAPDAPGLLAKVAGVLFAHGVNVHSARVFTRAGQKAVALDELLVDAHNHPLPVHAQAEIARDIRSVLEGSTPLAAILARHGRELEPGMPPRIVSINNELSDSYTVVEVGMPDEKGLLFRLASAMAALHWSIHNARIGTRAGEARDVFYITDENNAKIDANDLDLHVALSDGLAAGPSMA